MGSKLKLTSKEEKAANRRNRNCCLFSLIIFLSLAVAIAILSILLYESYAASSAIRRKLEEHTEAETNRERQLEVVWAINSNASLNWKAKFNRDAHGPGRSDIISFQISPADKNETTSIFIEQTKLGYQRSVVNYALFEELNLTLPREFNAADHFPKCKKRISSNIDQAGCGSCWAAAVTSALSDRLCIASDGKDTRVLSIEDMVSCCEYCGSCLGGHPWLANEFWVREGLVTGGPYGSRSGCKSYHSKPDCGSPCHMNIYVERGNPECEMKCTANTTINYAQDKIKGKEAYYFFPTLMNAAESSYAETLKKEIYLEGPISTSFNVYEDFLHYKTGVYEHAFGEKIYGHVIKIIGWGVEVLPDGEELDYWLAVNSWGKEWGDNGYVKLTTEKDFFQGFYAAKP